MVSRQRVRAASSHRRGAATCTADAARAPAHRPARSGRRGYQAYASGASEAVSSPELIDAAPIPQRGVRHNFPRYVTSALISALVRF
jgi:hypothetical protein